MAQNTPDEEVRRTLLCKNIPQSLTKRQLLKEHFEKFGTVLKVLTSQERGAASVEFETHEQAANARRLGTSYQSNDIIITWKRRLSHSNSSGAISKPVPPSTELFGKAISSATGVSPAVQPTRGFIQKDRGGAARLSDARGQRLLRMGAEGSAVGQAVKRPLASRVGPMKREPMAEGLYDDLPPPSDWSEESITPTVSKYTWKAKATTKSTAFGKKPATSAFLGKPKFRGFGESKSDATGGQGQTDLFGKPSTAGQSSAFGAGKPIVPSGILSQNFGKPAVQPTAAASGSQTSQRTLFGKTVQSGGALFANKPTPKVTSSGETPSAISQPSEDDHSADTNVPPTLFGKTKGQRPTSPKPSIMQRLSPARLMQPRARSASPSPSGRALPFTRSVSPSPQPPAPRSLPATVRGWVMPPSLISLAQGTANTCSERQSLLEKREKLMRQGISKQSDISRAQATHGCCPDMCPERERYLREERRRVHVFEMIPGTESMDHRLAVKEYSRSSADQEEPLPLELRPADVLARTMAYLCNNILDIGSNSNWGDWYDFLWSRTRAIRKDITQQHLCSRLAAGLVEQCARFHIYCGARLVEEDAMTFDTKINNENLTKCLQTLKEMYADLLKKDIVCESEAEFRSYMVLMNLNEGDTLREVQQLRPEVRSSPEIALALSAHAAVNERNYVKFFKVVKTTSVLNACILHRYFNQMRQEALTIILKAYSAPKGPALIGLKEFVASLYFESNEEASAFLQHYGMSSLSKDHYVEPENQLPVTRSPTLVEHKLQTSLGEAVYGRPLPPNNIPEPTTSFDSRGTFIGILQSTGSNQGGDAVSTPVEEEITPPDYQLPLPSDLPNQVVKDVTKEFICKIVDGETAAIARESLDEERQLLSYADHVVDEVVDEVVNQLLNTLATETLSEARKQRKAQIEAQRKKLREKVSLQIFTELIEEVEEDEAKAVAAQVYREVQVELMERRRRKCVDLVGEKLIIQHVDSLVKEVAEEVFLSDVVERKKTLQVAAECTKMARCRRTLRKWRAVYQKRNRLRDTMLSFPAAPPIFQRKREFKVTADVVTLGKRSRLAVGSPVDMTVAVGMSAKRRQLDLMLSNAHVNLRDLLTSALANDTNDSCYMKLVALLTDEPGTKDRQLSTWLTNKLSVGAVPEGDSEQGCLLTLTNFSLNSRKFDVCIRSYQPSVPTSGDLERTLYGTNMVVYLLPYTDQPTESYWSAVHGQLNALLESKPEWPAVPLLVISPLDVSQSDVENQISAYLPLGVVSHVRVDALHSTLEYSTLLPESLKWLVMHRPPPLDVQVTDLTSLVESCLASLFYSKVYADMADRQMEDVIDLGPGELISFFNETLVKLVEIMCDEELSLYSWPPHEHDLSVLSVEECEQLLRDWLPLPSFDQSEGVDWQLTCEDIKGYLQTVVDHYHSVSPWSWLEPREDSIPALYSRVTALLAKAETTFTTRCEKQLHHPPPLQPLRHNAPWLHIVVACVQFAISNLASSALVMHKRLPSDLRPLAAEFHPGERIKYRDTVSSAMAAAMIEATGSEGIDTDLSIHNSSIHALSSEVVEEKTHSLQFDAYLNESLAGVGEASPASCGTPPSEDPTQSLDDLIKREQEEAKTFEEFLHQSLLEEA